MSCWFYCGKTATFSWNNWVNFKNTASLEDIDSTDRIPEFQAKNSVEQSTHSYSPDDTDDSDVIGSTITFTAWLQKRSVMLIILYILSHRHIPINWGRNDYFCNFTHEELRLNGVNNLFGVQSTWRLLISNTFTLVFKFSRFIISVK